MRQLKNFLRKKKNMWNCNDDCCVLLKCWRENTCDCEDGWTPVVINYEQEAINAFTASAVYEAASDKPAALASATAIIEAAWEDWLKPFYDAVKAWNTFAKYVEDESLTVDETWTTDSVLNDDAAFSLYVSSMGAIDYKYLDNDWSGNLTNSTELDAYLATLE